MRLALFSDIHANLPALEAVLASIDAHRPDQVFCLGDLVGYAPWPNEVVELLRRRQIATLSGNYDDGVGRNSDDCGCAYKTTEERALGAESIAYTSRVITDEHRKWMRHLPRHIRLQLGAKAEYAILLVHGSPRRINEYLFEERPESSLLRIVQGANADLLACGHTHTPYLRSLQSKGEDGSRQWHAVNTGSVGKPKDGDPRAGWVLLHVDPEAEAGPAVEAQFIRVPYDVDAAARAVEMSPLPDAFANLLRTGGKA